MIPKYTPELAEKLRDEQLAFTIKLIHDNAKYGFISDDGCDDISGALLIARNIFNAERECYVGEERAWNEFWHVLNDGVNAEAMCDSIQELCGFWNTRE